MSEENESIFWDEHHLRNVEVDGDSIGIYEFDPFLIYRNEDTRLLDSTFRLSGVPFEDGGAIDDRIDMAICYIDAIAPEGVAEVLYVFTGLTQEVGYFVGMSLDEYLVSVRRGPDFELAREINALTEALEWKNQMNFNARCLRSIDVEGELILFPVNLENLEKRDE